MREKPQNHVHKFRRHRYDSGNVVFFCALDCSYKISPALALGKRSICWRCGDEFIMNDYSIRLAKPHCEKCHKPKNAVSYDTETQPVEIIRAPIPLPIEPLSGQRVDTAADLMTRLQSAIKPKSAEDEDI